MKIRIMAAVLAASVLFFWCRKGNRSRSHPWWTSGGEAAAVAELAKAFDATGNHWVDGAIAGCGNTARPIMISRITGGDPMGATQFNHGRQAEELVQAGLMKDLTDVATAGKWKDHLSVRRPCSTACTIDGKIYCVPAQTSAPGSGCGCRMPPSRSAGVAVPKNWDEFVAAAPALEKAGIVPLAVGGRGWQASGAFNVLMIAIAGKDNYLKVFKDKDAEVAAGPEIAKVFKAADDARRMSKGSNVQDWNQASNLVITGKAGGQIMGDWAQGEFQVAKQVAGKDRACLPGLGVNEIISTSGDAFLFPLQEGCREEAKAQDVPLPSHLLGPKTPVAFNLKKKGVAAGSARRRRPSRAQTTAPGEKGLDILSEGNIVTGYDQLVSPDTTQADRRPLRRVLRQ